MANRYYAAGEQRAAKVKDLFTAIAHRYDLINDLQSLGFHRRWKRQLVNMAGLRPGERALDLCCGTGDVALGLAKGNGTVVGLDFSMAMVVIAGKRARKLAANLQGRPHPREGSESTTGILEKPERPDAERQFDHARAGSVPPLPLNCQAPSADRFLLCSYSIFLNYREESKQNRAPILNSTALWRRPWLSSIRRTFRQAGRRLALRSSRRKPFCGEMLSESRSETASLMSSRSVTGSATWKTSRPA